MGSEWGLVSWKENPVYAVCHALTAVTAQIQLGGSMSLLSPVKVYVFSGAHVCADVCGSQDRTLAATLKAPSAFVVDTASFSGFHFSPWGRLAAQ